MDFVCKNCGYRFESAEEDNKKRCPYCGEMTVTREKSADDLINEE